MGSYNDIKQMIRSIVGDQTNLPVTGTVKSVSGDHCAVELANGYIATNVRLKTTLSGDDYYLMKPKVGSQVLCLSQSNDLRSLVVIKVNELDTLIFKQKDFEFELNAVQKKMKLKNNQTSFKNVLDDLADLIAELKVYTAVGPSGVPLPETQQKIQEFKSNLDKILM